MVAPYSTVRVNKLNTLSFAFEHVKDNKLESFGNVRLERMNMIYGTNYKDLFKNLHCARQEFKCLWHGACLVVGSRACIILY